jgi:mercuric ion transport protein
MKSYLDKVGSFGSLFTAAACPACFPQLAALGTVVGLSAFTSYEAQIFLATKVLVVVAILGHVLAYRSHRRLPLAVLGAGGGILFFLGMYLFRSEAAIYLGLIAMVAASLADLVQRLRMRRRLALRTNPE